MDKKEKSLADDLFIRYIKTRDEECFRELFRQVDSWLFVTIYALTGNRQEASDILQEAWVKVIENSEKFDIKKGCFRNFIYTVAKNIALNNKKRNNKYMEMLSEIEIENENPEIRIETIELGKILRTAVKELKNKSCQDTIILYYFGGFNLAEITQMMDTKEYNVLNWLKRGRKQLEMEIKSHPDYKYFRDTILKMIGVLLMALEIINVSK